MASTVKQALADAGVVAPTSTGADAPSTNQLALAQRGAGVRHFTLAEGAEWVPTAGGKLARTIGRNDVLMLSYVPEGGRIAEIPLYAVIEAGAAGAFDLSL